MQTKTMAKGLTMLVLAGTLSVAAPQVASASDYINPCDLSTKIDELQGFGSDKSKNIVVYKESARKSSRFNGIVSSGTVRATPCGELFGLSNYHWVVFKGDGEFVRKGDGGYRNWAFYGRWTRNDSVVKFHRR
ncbi:hypothetical protein [Amycolatopsis sp.]|jgi:hypothetical protein|uniref:hypothetical protein n=1 Tax=Amycolatopsis sp. TaxID=37632 RepID=UPI002E0C2FDC|nr:hypothetical protein [Amycolatopsis sp.]